jgi:hypothetical protein
MSGIGGESSGRLVTVQHEMPEDIDGILDAVRKIILLGRVQSITLQDGEPIVYRRLVNPGEEAKAGESTQSFAELTPLEIVRNVPMEEFAWDDKKTPQEQLLWMFLFMSTRKWTVTHILLSEDTKFWKWLGFPVGPMNDMSVVEQYLGARIERDDQLPSDVFILCGARTRHATISEIGFSLKGNMVDG